MAADDLRSMMYGILDPLVRKPIRLILLLAFFVRVGVILLYADFNNDYYWEHGEIAKNLLAGKGYSYFVTNELRTPPRSPDADPAPTAYMPPGYVAYLAPFLLIENAPLRNGLLLLSHILISTATVGLLHRLASRIFCERAALVASATAALIPEFLYATLSFTPTVLYHLLVVLLFLRLWDLDHGKRRAWDIGLMAALLIYLRSEFALFVILLLLVLIWQREYRNGMVIAAVAAASLAPWVIRNYVVFDAVVPMSTSFGLNLYRGHNPDAIGAWGDEQLADELRVLDRNKFEIGMNRIYRDRALDFMRENPGTEARNSLLKIVRFWSFDPRYEKSTHPLYYVPNILIVLLGVIGTAGAISWKKYRYYYLFFLHSILIVILFFPLPRYQTMMKLLVLPFAARGALQLYGIARERMARRRRAGSEF